MSRVPHLPKVKGANPSWLQWTHHQLAPALASAPLSGPPLTTDHYCRLLQVLQCPSASSTPGTPSQSNPLPLQVSSLKYPTQPGSHLTVPRRCPPKPDAFPRSKHPVCHLHRVGCRYGVRQRTRYIILSLILLFRSPSVSTTYFLHTRDDAIYRLSLHRHQQLQRVSTGQCPLSLPAPVYLTVASC